MYNVELTNLKFQIKKKNNLTFKAKMLKKGRKRRIGWFICTISLTEFKSVQPLSAIISFIEVL